jgi:ATP-dependent Clp protease ATP-binding subunit ClpB
MSPQKFTAKLQEALQDALDIASTAGHPEIGPAHLLVALLKQDGGLAQPLF